MEVIMIHIYASLENQSEITSLMVVSVRIVTNTGIS